MIKGQELRRHKIKFLKIDLTGNKYLKQQIILTGKQQIILTENITSSVRDL